MQCDLSGRVAFVTGAAGGIGRAIVERLSANGAAVVVADINAEGAEAVAATLPNAIAAIVDIRDEAAIERAVDRTVQRFGRLDILVNNAGTTALIPHADLDAVSDDVFRRILDVNLLGTWYLSRAALPELRKSDRGVIVNVTSLAGVRPTGSSIPYAVSKAAINHLTRLLAKVVGPVRVNAVAPGLVATPWTKDWAPIHAAVQQNAPLGRSATAEDVADTIYGVIISRYMTGEVVVLDGGLGLVS